MSGLTSRILAGTTSLFKGTVLGRRASQESAEDTSEQKEEVTNPHSPPPTVTPGKRERSSDDTEAQQSKKRQRDMSYRADWAYPEKVKSIHPPSAERESPVNETMAQPNKRKPGAGGHRFRDTLNGNPYAAGQGTSSSQRSRAIPRREILNYSGLALRASAGANTQSRRTVQQFEEHDDQSMTREPAAKRAKTSGNPTGLTVESSPIDLTVDSFQGGYEFNEARSRNVGHSQHKEPSDHVFNAATDNEARKALDIMEVQQEKKRRKPRTSTSQGSGSIGSAEHEAMDERFSMNSKRSSPTVVVLSPTSTRSPRAQTKERLPINLGKDVDKQPQLSSARQSNGKGKNQTHKTPGEREQEMSARIGVRMTPKHATDGQVPTVHEILEDIKAKEAVKSRQPPKDELDRKQSSKYFATQPEEKSLKSTFIRDNSRPKLGQKATRAVNRMQEQSRPGMAKKVSPIDESSDDELNGPITIESNKQQNPVTNRQMRRASPSDLPRTRFTTRARAVPRHSDSHENQLPLPPEHDGPHVHAFYSLSCVSTNGSVDLDYTAQPKAQINIFDDNVKCDISLTEAAVQKVYWSPDSCNVHIKGAQSDFSNGNICITFYNGHNRDWFLQTMRSISKNMVEEKKLEPNHMEKLFIHQCDEIEVAYKRNMKILAAKLQKYREHEAQSDENEIQYEPQPRTSSPLATTTRRNNTYGSRRVPTRQVQIRKKTPTPPPKWSEIHKPKQWKEAVTYPATGPRRVTVDFHDLPRLDDGEFLNDNLVSFALKRIEENIAPEHRDSVYFFNSFFYTSLMKKNGKVAFNYDNVKRWTKNKDIFTVPFIVVPINLNFHWFVAIICNLPNLKREFDASSDIEVDPPVEGNDETATSVAKDEAANNKNMSQLSISENDENVGDVFEFGEDNTVLGSAADDKAAKTGKKGKRKSVPPMRTYNVDQPVIITLDSFGTSRSPEIRNLKDYVIAEADAKREMKIGIGELQGLTAKGIPEQDNYCDCGVYLVGYVEEFAKNPRRFVDKILKRDFGLKKDFDGFSASAKRAEIRDDLLLLSGDADAKRTKEKQAKATARTGNQAASALPTKAEKQPEATADESTSRRSAEAPPKTLGTAISSASEPLRTEVVDDSQEALYRKEEASWTPNNRIAADEKHVSTHPKVIEAETQNSAEDDEEMLDNGTPDGKASPYVKFKEPYKTILENISSPGEPTNASSETIRAEHEASIFGLDGTNDHARTDEHSQSITIPESQET